MMSEKNDWLKKSLADKFNDESAPVGADLWDKIEPRIQEKPKKKRILWIWLLFGVLGLGAMGLVVWNYAAVDKLVTHGEKDGSNKNDETNLQELVTQGEEQNVISEIAVGDNRADDMQSTEGRARSADIIIEKNISNQEKGIRGNEKSSSNKKTIDNIFENKIINFNNDEVVFEEIKKEALGLANASEEANKNLSNENDLKENDSEAEKQNAARKDSDLLGLLSLQDKLDYPLIFERRNEFSVKRRMKMGAKPLPKKGKWYVGTGFSLHRQLIYPNKADEILIRPVNFDTSGQEKKMQFGISIHLGRTFDFNKKLEGFSELSLGINYLSHLFSRETIGFDFSSIDLLDANTIRLNVDRNNRDIFNREVFASGGLKLGVNYQPLERIPVRLTLGVLGQYNISSSNFTVKNNFEIGVFGGFSWEIGEEKRFQMNVRTALPFNKIFWGWDGEPDLYQSRRQSVQLSLNYRLE